MKNAQRNIKRPTNSQSPAAWLTANGYTITATTWAEVLRHVFSVDLPEAEARETLALMIDAGCELAAHPEPAKTETETAPGAGAAPAGDAVSLFTDAVSSVLSGGLFSRLLEQHRGNIHPGVGTLIVKNIKGDVAKVDGPHPLLERVVRAVSAGVNVRLVGPAGSGKTTIAKQAAAALGLEYFGLSGTLQTGVHELFGYMDATGNYVATQFRRAYERGGLFLLDEFDATNPNILASINQAIDADCAPFPDAVIRRHEDFRFMVAGNSLGTEGRNSRYAKSSIIDASTLDRFRATFFVDYDTDFERELSGNPDWAEKVQTMRQNAESKKVNVLISPRATIAGAKLLAAGFSELETAKMAIFPGLSEEEITLITAGITLKD